MGYGFRVRGEGERLRHETIVDAAEAVFARISFHAPRIGDIASWARVSRALSDLHFKNKSELQLAVCLRALRLLCEQLVADSDRQARSYDKITAIAMA